jgi:catechol 2,3-dioxygenase
VQWTGLPAGTVIGHVHLYVTDLEVAAQFYHRGLGLDKVVWSYPGALFMSAGGYHHHLGTNTWAAGAPRSGPEDARLLEWEVVVPTAREAAEAARSLTMADAPVRQEGDEWLAVDPWGTTVRLRDKDPGAESGG